MKIFNGRLALQQRVLPEYRAPFFDLLAKACTKGLSVFAGEPLPIESINTASSLGYAQLHRGRNRHFFHPRHPLYFCRQDGLIDWLETWDPDALIVEANSRYQTTPNAIRWMHAKNRPVLGWGLGAAPLSGPMAVLRNRFLASLDGLISYSKKGTEGYRALNVVAPDRIFTAPNAVSPAPTDSVPEKEPHLQHPLTLLFVGRLQRRKRVDLLVQACAQLPAEIAPNLIIVGDGPARAAFEAAALENFPNTIFAGAQYGDDLTAHFKQADLFVLPGTGGLAVQQAMGFGLPVIVAQGDGTQSDLVRAENGWQVVPESLESLTDTLQIALENPALLRTMGAEGFRIVKEEVNAEKMVERFVEALNQIHL